MTPCKNRKVYHGYKIKGLPLVALNGLVVGVWGLPSVVGNGLVVGSWVDGAFVVG